MSSLRKVPRRRRVGYGAPEVPAATGAGTTTGGALDELFRARYEPSVRLAVLLVGDMASAEEIVQDAFVELARRWDRLNNPAGYLRTAVVNRCKNHRRHLARIRRHPVPPLGHHVDAPKLDELWAHLARLPARRRAAIVLRYYEDLPVTEIARLLACRPGTISSLLHRGLADLRKVLNDDA